MQQIIRAICVSLSYALPEYTIYDEGQVPQNFVRPSLCIVPGEGKHTPLNIRITKHEITITIFVFPPLLDSGAAHLPNLQDKVAAVCAVFRCGFVKVGDRAVKIVGSVKSDCSVTDGFVEFVLSYTDSVQAQQAETMRNIEIKNNTYLKGE